MRYRRAFIPGGCYFFTVVTYQRRKLFEEKHALSILRESIRKVRINYPFTIDAMVVLPDHLHCVWTMPEGDADYSKRWRLVKTHVTKAFLRDSLCASARTRTRIWQPRFWEHLLSDMADYQAHIDYIHFNPVRHGYATKPIDWPYSSLRHYVARGILPEEWGAGTLDQPDHIGHE